jgi:hypothetical protein
LADGGNAVKVKAIGVSDASEDDRAPGVKPGGKSAGCLFNDLVVGKRFMKDFLVSGKDIMAACIQGLGFQESLLETGSVLGVGVRTVACTVAEFPGKRDMSPDDLGDGQDPRGSRKSVGLLMEGTEMLVLEDAPLQAKSTKEQLAPANAILLGYKSLDGCTGKAMKRKGGVVDPRVDTGDEQVQKDLTGAKRGTALAEGNKEVIDPADAGGMGTAEEMGTILVRAPAGRLEDGQAWL